MWNKYNVLSWAFLMLIVTPCFHFVNAKPRKILGKHVKEIRDKISTPQHQKVLRNSDVSDDDDDDGTKETHKNNGGGDVSERENGSSPSATKDNDEDSQKGMKETGLNTKATQSKVEPHSDNEYSQESGVVDEYPVSNNNVENEKHQEKDKNEQKLHKRSVRSGDIFSPHDLLPVTTILMKKLNLAPGEGKGIVSSSKNAQDMADRIFAAYFATMRRIIILKDEDLEGLNALQALAIEGEPANLRSKTGQRDFSAKTQRRVLIKKVSKSEVEHDRKPQKVRRRKIRLELEKLMPKNRHLIVNSKRWKKKQINETTTEATKVSTAKPENVTSKSQRKKFPQRGCSWRYDCEKPNDLDSCKLITKCMKEVVTNINVSPPVKKETEETQVLVRRSTGLTQIDEEVEKIIENHMALIRPENPNDRIEKVESLDQYFNNIIITQNEEQTTLPPAGEKEEKSEEPNAKESSKENTEEENSEDGNKSSEMKPYLEQLEENSGKERDWRTPPFGLPLRHPGEYGIKRSMSKASNEGSRNGNNVISTDKPAARKVTPRIVRLIPG